MIIWFLTHCWVPGALRVISMTVALPVMKGTFYLTKKTSHGAGKRPWARGAGQGHSHSQVGARGWGTHRDGGCTQPGPGALPSLSDTRSQRHERPLLLSMLFNEYQRP